MKRSNGFLFCIFFVLCISNTNALSATFQNSDSLGLIGLIRNIDKLKPNNQNYNLTSISSSKVAHLISDAYSGDIKHVSNILTFLRATQGDNNKYIGYTTLAKEMIENGHQFTEEMLKLVYFVKLAMTEVAANIDLISKYNQLKNTFPSGMQAVIFQQVVTIKNDYYGEYIYNADYDPISGYYFTWRPGNQVSQGDFSLDPRLDTNNNMYFLINNESKDSKVCLSGNFYDGGGNHDREKVNGCSSSDNWYLIPRGNRFAIKTSWGRTLYSPDDKHAYDGDRRWLLAWISDLSDSSNAQWIIE